jgi:regulator of sigma E protease
MNVMSILKFVFVLLEVLLLFNLLIFVHELGHFLAARWRGLKIDRFALWFGKPIWKKKINGIEYALGPIPAGGYVALPQMATMEAIEGKSESAGESLPAISPLDKSIVAVAGPFFSFLLAIGFAVVVWGVGRPVSEEDNSTTIGWVDPEGPAWQAGLRPGDQIKAVDGHPVTAFSPPSQDSVKWRIVTSEGKKITFDYVRNNTNYVAEVAPTNRPTKWYERKALRQVMMDVSRRAIIGEVATNGPAALAGLCAGDEVVALNGEKIYSPFAVLRLQDSLSNAPPTPVAMTIRRDGKEFERTIEAERPVKPAKCAPSFGITAWQFESNVKLVHTPPGEQIRESVGQIAATLGAVFSRKGDIGIQQLGGPVMIIRLYTNLFGSDEGWRRVLWWSVVLNVNLALLNMLPFPVLDGGHILLALIEFIRRRPVSAAVLNYLQTACAALLIGLLLLITFYDSGDWFRSARQDREEPIQFAPRN